MHLQRLHRIAASIADGVPRENAIRAARPPVFFKRIGSVMRALGLWTPDATVGRLMAWGEAEQPASEPERQPTHSAASRARLSRGVRPNAEQDQARLQSRPSPSSDPGSSGEVRTVPPGPRWPICTRSPSFSASSLRASPLVPPGGSPQFLRCRRGPPGGRGLRSAGRSARERSPPRRLFAVPDASSKARA